MVFVSYPEGVNRGVKFEPWEKRQWADMVGRLPLIVDEQGSSYSRNKILTSTMENPVVPSKSLAKTNVMVFSPSTNTPSSSSIVTVLGARLLENNGNTGFIVGKDLTVADLKLYWIIDWLTSGILDGIPTSLFDPYTNILTWRRNIADIRESRLAATG